MRKRKKIIVACMALHNFIRESAIEMKTLRDVMKMKTTFRMLVKLRLR
uniref:Uncharacterized protein n=1 Tax=Arundo donax TaxID=35708 RepID=A0A0A9ALW2_ARUDO